MKVKDRNVVLLALLYTSIRCRNFSKAIVLGEGVGPASVAASVAGGCLVSVAASVTRGSSTLASSTGGCLVSVAGS